MRCCPRRTYLSPTIRTWRWPFKRPTAFHCSWPIRAPASCWPSTSDGGGWRRESSSAQSAWSCGSSAVGRPIWRPRSVRRLGRAVMRWVTMSARGSSTPDSRTTISRPGSSPCHSLHRGTLRCDVPRPRRPSTVGISTYGPPRATSSRRRVCDLIGFTLRSFARQVTPPFVRIVATAFEPGAWRPPSR